MAMPTKPCMVMLRTGVDGAHYQEDAAVGCGARVRVCVCVWVGGCVGVRLSVSQQSLTSQTQSTQESASQRDGLYDNYTVG